VHVQIYWLNCGLARWDAVNNVPVFQSFWITVSVIGGGVFYDEFSGFSPVQCAMFPFGIVLTVIGVYYLTRREITARRRASTLTIPTDAKLLCTDNEEVPTVVLLWQNTAGVIVELLDAGGRSHARCGRHLHGTLPRNIPEEASSRCP
jgi:hypothetical protein